MAMDYDNKKLVEQFIHNAWGRGRHNLIRQMVSRDFLYHACQSLDTCGIDCFVDEVEMLRNAIGDFNLAIEDIMCDGDRAISIMTLCGSFVRPVFGIKPTNKMIGITCAVTWQLQRGKVRHINMMVDMAHMQKQVAAA
jgi:predicted ester cyclase